MTSTRKVPWRARGGAFDRAAAPIERMSSASCFPRMLHIHNDSIVWQPAALPRGASGRPW